ncbi:hypothetical protein E2562_025662 [Oryza meyeriana var. granulata]|uniref:Uncharacterized protein n=1 Tax=Oryza meyeriana var. granulata TaxID=110450 RepID=A0A6G1FCI8_9ORYZ|nr:hypothetical protein E2562_025662 [Oryza meyeriana var. granulata]
MGIGPVQSICFTIATIPRTRRRMEEISSSSRNGELSSAPTEEADAMMQPGAKTLCLLLTPFPPPAPPRLRFHRLTATAAAGSTDNAAAASGTTARERRLAKVREERRRRQHDRDNTYPGWARHFLPFTLYFSFPLKLYTGFASLPLSLLKSIHLLHHPSSMP